MEDILCWPGSYRSHRVLMKISRRIIVLLTHFSDSPANVLRENIGPICGSNVIRNLL